MCNEESLKMNSILNFEADTQCLEKTPFEGFCCCCSFLLLEEIHLGLSDLFSQTFSV